jgi:hypothetical protein
MKTILMLPLLFMFPLTVSAGELRITLEGGGISGTFTITTNEMSCGRLNWDGVPDKSGKMSGGQYEITVQMVNNEVVLKERTLASDKGIRSDITAKTIIPLDKISWTGKISQTMVTLFWAQQKEEGKPPNKELETTR